jgi:hypothetical protein
MHLLGGLAGTVHDKHASGPHSSLTKVPSGQCAIKATLYRSSKVGVVFRFRDILRRNKKKHNNRINTAQHIDLLSGRFLCNYRYPSVVRRDLGQKPLLAAAGRCAGLAFAMG